MRKLLPLLLFVFLCSTFKVLCQNNYKVFITALENKIPASHFTGLNNLTFEKDANDLYKVYAGAFAEKTTAEQVVQDAISKGYKYARVIDLQLQQEICSQSCREPFLVRNIFFGFNQSLLRNEAKADLDKLADLLHSQLGYRVQLSGHTDAKGNDSYNVELSKKRVENAKTYLTQKGIVPERILIAFAGETSPVAKNKLNNGVDSPNGRQLNRRVEVILYDSKGTIINDLVEEIKVPSNLQN